MSFTPETLCLHKLSRMPYLSLPTTPQCQVTYIWINMFATVPKGKTRTLDSEPQSVQDVPEWFGTYSFQGRTYEITLVPVKMFRDPFTLDPNKLVLCEARDLDGSPAPGHRRSECMKVMEAVKDQKPWFGFEQEFMLMALDGLPFGWTPDFAPKRGVSGQVGLNNVYGRNVSISHYKACLYAGIKICGITNETIPAQWEFQIGPCDGTELGDHAWVARYILHRVCEDFGVMPSFHPKPIKHPRWCTGGHMNFSTEDMRSDGGIKHIHAAIERLALRHAEHMAVYGSEENVLRLNNVGLNSSFNEFSWGTASRKGSVRIPGQVHREGRGYLEDRRPSADCDPYLVCKALMETCLLPPGDGSQDGQERQDQTSVDQTSVDQASANQTITN